MITWLLVLEVSSTGYTTYICHGRRQKQSGRRPETLVKLSPTQAGLLSHWNLTFLTVSLILCLSHKILKHLYDVAHAETLPESGNRKEYRVWRKMDQDPNWTWYFIIHQGAIKVIIGSLTKSSPWSPLYTVILLFLFAPWLLQFVQTLIEPGNTLVVSFLPPPLP